MIFHTLSFNLWPIRVHEFFAREICLLQSKNPSLWVPTLSMQPLQADVEHPHKETNRKRWRNAPGLLEAILVQGRSLKSLTPRTGLTQQPWTPLASGHAAVCVGTRVLRLPTGPLVLLLDGLYFRFQGKDWVLYVMAVKPCRQNRAVFLDPVLLPGRENMQAGLRYSQPFPPPYTDASGLGLRRDFRNYQARTSQAGSCSSAISISSADCSNAGADAIADCMQTPARSALPTCPPAFRCPIAPGCKPCSKNSGILFGRQKACASCA